MHHCSKENLHNIKLGTNLPVLIIFSGLHNNHAVQISIVGGRQFDIQPLASVCLDIITVAD